MTHAELMALPFHPDWDDGREGFIWARFDAVVDRATWDRAEVTWDDNGDRIGARTRDVVIYSEPRLLLETNRWVGESPHDELRTVDGIELVITEEEARRVISEPPSALRDRYAKHWQRLARSPAVK